MHGQPVPIESHADPIEYRALSERMTAFYDAGMSYDVVIVGGGPAGLSAALALGRARRAVLLCDSGPRRNAAAEHINNFVTRDGTPPDEFRQVGRQQLGKYPNVEVRDVRVRSISGSRGDFTLTLESGIVRARRVLLCTGMIDQMLPVEGFTALWGHSVFQCPYCHGWELQDRRWGCLAQRADLSRLLNFALMLKGWTPDVTIFMAEALDLPEQVDAQLQAAGIRIERSPVSRLNENDGRLVAVDLQNGSSVPCDVLFAHPPQRQVELVRNLALALDDDGFVQVDAMKRETSISGMYAAGDLTTRGQGAILAAAAGTQAAVSINVDVMTELTSVPPATLPA